MVISYYIKHYIQKQTIQIDIYIGGSDRQSGIFWKNEKKNLYLLNMTILKLIQLKIYG